MRETTHTSQLLPTPSQSSPMKWSTTTPRPFAIERTSLQ